MSSDEAGKPGELPWLFIRAGKERSHHMEGDDQHHRFRTQAVQVADELAHRHAGDDVHHVLVRHQR